MISLSSTVFVNGLDSFVFYFCLYFQVRFKLTPKWITKWQTHTTLYCSFIFTFSGFFSAVLNNYQFDHRRRKEKESLNLLKRLHGIDLYDLKASSHHLFVRKAQKKTFSGMGFGCPDTGNLHKTSPCPWSSVFVVKIDSIEILCVRMPSSYFRLFDCRCSLFKSQLKSISSNIHRSL